MAETFIPAKPTRYKGTQYRSRLEASWAVFWEAMGLETEYEPVMFSGGKECSCDFKISTSGGFSFLQEVKPLFPNDDYRTILLKQASSLAINGYPLILTVGGFRDKNLPLVYHFPFWPCWESSLISFSDWFSCDVNFSISAAKNIRWDLCEI
jgi:hypothetical protein